MYNCVVRKIIFENKGNGYKVAEVYDKERGENIIAVGILPNICVGDQLKLEGEWRVHPAYGKRFQISNYSLILPSNRSDLIKFLSSGFIDGIGAKLATSIVNALGDDLLDKIEEKGREVLISVPGIGKKRSEMIINSLKEKFAQKELAMFFANNDLPLGLVNKIYKMYGAESIKVLKENPYRLAEEITGIGFKRADKLALSIGFSKDEPKRIRAAVLHELLNAVNEGHVFLPEKSLLERACSLLKIDKVKCSDVVNTLCDEKTLIRKEIQSDYGVLGSAIYLPYLWLAETEVAQEIKRRKGNFMLVDSAPDALINDFERSYEMSLDDIQRLAIKQALANKIFVVTGGPGTGKTTIIKIMILLYRQYGIKFALAAPTGRAARRLEELTGVPASTIHKLLEYDQYKEDFGRNDKNLLDYQAIIVDEASMIDIILFSKLLKAIPSTSQLIIIGDKDQLPSVGPGNVLKDLIESKVVNCIQLKKIYRQAYDSLIVKGAYNVNMGLFPFMITNKKQKGDFYFINQDQPSKAIDILVKLFTKKFNQYSKKELIQDVQVISPMYKGIVGVDNLNAKLRELLNPITEEAIVINNFRMGDKVMQTVNNYSKNVFNGDIGYIIDIDTVFHTVSVDYGDKLAHYDVSDLDELTLAYAITAHKAEGSEFEVVIILLFREHFIMLGRNWLYTAITRAKSKLIIIGEKEAIEMAIRNESTSYRFTYLMKKLREQNYE